MGRLLVAGVRKGMGDMRTQPLSVEVVGYAPTEFFHCLHCEVVFQHVGVGQKIHAEQRESTLPEDLRREYAALGAWVEQTAARWPDAIRFKIIDAASLEGLYKTLRHGLRRFPAVVVDGRDKAVGGDLDAATALIERQLGAEAEVGGGRATIDVSRPGR